MADVIVEARVEKIGDDRVTVTPMTVRKGALPSRVVDITGLETSSPDVITSCDINPVPGRNYVFLAYAPLPGESDLTAVDWQDGMVELSAATELLETTGLSSPWARAANGLWFRAAISKPVFARSEPIDIFTAVRNAGPEPHTLRLRGAPWSEPSRCSIEGDGITGIRVPNPQDEIDAHLASLRPAQDIVLQRSKVLAMYHRNITGSDWLSKESLDFKYYAIPPGRHEIGISCQGLGSEVLRTQLTLSIE